MDDCRRIDNSSKCFASVLPSILAVIVRFTEAGTNAVMMRFSRPGTILDRFSRNALRPQDTHCSTLIGFIGMVRGSNPSLARTGVFVSGGGTTVSSINFVNAAGLRPQDSAFVGLSNFPSFDRNHANEELGKLRFGFF
jgi:hypothetical protein